MVSTIKSNLTLDELRKDVENGAINTVVVGNLILWVFHPILYLIFKLYCYNHLIIYSSIFRRCGHANTFDRKAFDWQALCRIGA